MNKESDFVSVIIPCYNHGKYILETVKSVLDQTYSNYEIIIVDDGSDDPHTIKVLNVLDHPKVTVLHKENGHVSSARNHGIKHSKGEYILTLDADDKFNPDFMMKAIQVLKGHSDVGVVTCYAKVFDHKGNISYQHKLGGGVKAFLTVNNCLASALFRFRCWEEAGGYNESMKEGFEDWDFWLSVTSAGWRIHSIPEYLYWYRDTPGSMVKSATVKKPELMRTIAKNHELDFQNNVIDVLYSKELKIQELSEIHNSRTYQIGNAFTKPLKYIRGLFNKGNRQVEISNHPANLNI
ncbi:MAG: glycosyltransferase family A protein [Balneolales bacterium]